MTDDRRSDSDTKRACTAISADGSPCRAWAVRGSDPPRCAPHGGGAAPVGAPLDNQNARTHGFYARHPLSLSRIPSNARGVDATIADLCIRDVRMTRYIEDNRHHLSVEQLTRFCDLRAKNRSRLTRLVTEQYQTEAVTPTDLKDILLHVLKQHGIDTEDPA